MFKVAVRAARTTSLAARSNVSRGSTSALRAFSVTSRASSDAPVPQLFGPGGKPGVIPTDFDQATGLERLQLLGEMEGIDVFDSSPLDSSRIGTKANPILVPSLDVTRIIGCTGSPADSHEVLWFTVTRKRQERCTECGSVYALHFQGEEEDHVDHGHH